MLLPRGSESLPVFRSVNSCEPYNGLLPAAYQDGNRNRRPRFRRLGLRERLQGEPPRSEMMQTASGIPVQKRRFVERSTGRP